MALTTKWDCPVCTYLNWSSSVKCTLCGCNKPLSISIPKSNIAKIKQSTQNSLILKPSSSKAGETSSDHNKQQQDKSKWPCSECTYLNWSNVSICKICSTSRVNNSTPPLNELTRKNSDSIFDYVTATSGGATPSLDVINKPKKHNRRNSPQHDKKSPTTSTSSMALTSSNKKWRCPTCTYENWPRSIKCVMCLRPPSPTVVGAVGGGDSEDDTMEVVPSLSSQGRHTHQYDSSPNNLSSPRSSSKQDLRQIRNRMNTIDWLYLEACRGVVQHDFLSIRAYLKQGGDRTRQLTQDEVLILNEPSKFTVGSTLVHLAVRFQRSNMLTYLLTPAPVEARKRLPSHVNPDLAVSIRQQVSLSLCQHQGDWACYFITQLTTFILPKEITDLSPSISQKLLEEIIDHDVQKELQEEAPIINWCNEITNDLHSRLYPLWNRTAGDCLLDSALQATWGVVDRESTLRQALSDSLSNATSKLYERWKESELRQAYANGFSIEEDQLRFDWSAILSSADQKGQSLEQTHVFVLAHILRRPLIVYAVKVVKNFKGEQLGPTNFEGIYLPLLWDSSFCWKVPIALGYTRGHFSALVGMEQPKSTGNHVTYLPLVDSEMKRLPLHFISEQEIGCYEDLIKEYCDCHVTSGGVLTARQIVVSQDQPYQLIQLMDEWMDRFFRLNKRQEATSNDIS